MVSSAFVRSDTETEEEGLPCRLCFNSSQRCSVGLKSGVCAGKSSSSTPKLLIHGFIDLALCTSMQTGNEGLSRIPEQTIPYHNPPSTKRYTWHKAFR